MPAATYDLVDMSAVSTPVVTERSNTPVGQHILVVDDTDFARRSAGILIERGLKRPVRFADNGRSALEDITLCPPCAVVTDLQMPDMDGIELVEAIRKSYPHIPVVLMTAYGSAEVAMQALRVGAASYVGKGDLARMLVDTLTQVMGANAGHQKRRKIVGCQTSKRTEFTFDNDPELINPLLGMVQEDLIDFKIGDETTRTRISVAIQESLANALYHGNLECSSDLRQEDERVFYRLASERRRQAPYRYRKIHLHTSMTPHQARFVITDEGPGFDVSSLDKPFDPEDLLRIGGRGMLLIRTFMDEVSHNATGNQITLVKNA